MVEVAYDSYQEKDHPDILQIHHWFWHALGKVLSVDHAHRAQKVTQEDRYSCVKHHIPTVLVNEQNLKGETNVSIKSIIMLSIIRKNFYVGIKIK